MTSYTPSTLNYPQLANTAIRRVKFDHAPNTVKNFILGDEWLDTSDTPQGQWWKLSTLATGGLVWVRIGGGLGNVQSLTGNTGGRVGPDPNANINTIGASPYVVNGNPTTHTLTWTDNGTIAYTYTGNTGVAVPALNNLNIFGAVVAAGTTPVATVAGGSTVTTNVQISQGIAASDATKIGLSNFYNANFSVDANGFVSLLGLHITFVNHAASPYTVLSTDQYIAVDATAGVVTLLLPNAPSTGRVIYIKDQKGQSSTNNISVTTVGGAVTLDGATTYTLLSNYAAGNFIFDGTSYEVF